MPDPFEEKRLRTLWDSAIETAAFRNGESAKASIEVAKDRVQYFEKIAFGSGATIAALVSFLGSHASKLQPPWLLRACLSVLALTMTCAMFRNWIYPFYLMASRIASEFEAKRKREQRKRDYILSTVQPFDIEDGKPIDITEWLEQYEHEDRLYGKDIDERRAAENRNFALMKASENATLFLALVAMLLLISLGWKNF